MRVNDSDRWLLQVANRCVTLKPVEACLSLHKSETGSVFMKLNIENASLDIRSSHEVVAGLYLLSARTHYDIVYVQRGSRGEREGRFSSIAQ